MKIIRYLLPVALFLGLLPGLAAQQVPIGQWRDELPYTYFNSVTDAGTRVYGSTPYAVVRFDKEDNSITRITKISGLSDIGISCINYNREYQTLVIAYSNANIDLIKNNIIINISDIKRKQILGNKTINSIYFNGKDAYLSCGFGIVVLDIAKEEIRDTYYIGKDGGQINVLALTMNGNDSIFAATEKGIYKAWSKDPNLANFQVWKRDTGIDTASSYNTITSFAGKIFTNKQKKSAGTDTIYRYENRSWVPQAMAYYNPVMHLQSNDKYLVVSYNYFVVALDANLQVYTYIWGYDPGAPFPQDAIADQDGLIWVADLYSGLIYYDKKNNYYRHLNLGGPLSALAFSMTSSGNDIYIAPGGRDASYIPIYNPAQIYHFDNTNWHNIAGYNSPYMDSAFAIVALAVDPFNPKHMYAGSFGRGLIELVNDSAVMIYNESNSTLKHHSSSNTKDVRVGGVAFDASGNVWAVCSHNNTCLSMRKGNQWYGFTIPQVNENDLGTLMINKHGQKWIQMRYGNMNPNSILVFTDNGTPENPGDDQARLLNSTVGNGNIPGNYVNAMAEDLKGEIWVGTEKGVAVFYTPENIFTGQNFDAQRILVTQGGYVQYLLENETVTAIAVDGANRKWIGTDRGGVFLFSEDGTKQIYHFTAENSPLLSDRIVCLAINSDGEVFFGTDKGVVSFRSSATPGGDTNENVYAFPNPVKEGYEGYIAIRGLVVNAQVKITDVNGVLVYSTIAEGGQAVWNGKNFDGRKAQTGVYLVFASKDDGTEKVVTKILIVN
jgi:ligand-binding sensor domain-containing protein